MNLSVISLPLENSRAPIAAGWYRRKAIAAKTHRISNGALKASTRAGTRPGTTTASRGSGSRSNSRTATSSRYSMSKTCRKKLPAFGTG